MILLWKSASKLHLDLAVSRVFRPLGERSACDIVILSIELGKFEKFDRAVSITTFYH